MIWVNTPDLAVAITIAYLVPILGVKLGAVVMTRVCGILAEPATTSWPKSVPGTERPRTVIDTVAVLVGRSAR